MTAYCKQFSGRGESFCFFVFLLFFVQARSQCTGPPLTPGTISGPFVVCSGNTATYSVAQVSGATSYSWSIPGVWTGTSTTNTLVVSIPVSSSGAILAYASNSCGISPPQTLSITVNPAPIISFSSTAYTVCPGHPTSLSGTGQGAVSYTWTGGITNAINFFPSLTSTFMVTGTSSLGCTATGVATIVVIPAPNGLPSIIPPAICNGGSSVMTATGTATAYTWLPGNSSSSVLVVSPSVTTTYTLIKTNIACSFSQVVQVTVYPNPTLTINSVTASVCAGSTVVLTGAGASSYAWTGGLTNGVPFSPTVTGSYTVIGTSVNTCTGSASATVTVGSAPPVTLNVNSPVVCMGGSVSLGASGATSYFWSGGIFNNIPFIPSGSAIFTVTATGNNGCTQTSTVSVTVLPLPTVTIGAFSSICPGQTISLTAGGAQSYTWSTGAFSNSIQVSPLTTSTFAVAGTGTNNCISSTTKTLLVNPLPVLSIAGNTAICTGKSEVLTVTGASSYTWNTGSTSASLTISPTITSTYTVVGIDLNGCIDSLNLQVVVLPAPTVSLGSNSNEICVGERIVLTASGADQYLWNLGNTTSTVTLFPKVTTTYTVTGTYTNGCSNTATYTQKVQPCTGLDKMLTNGTGVYFYPNPSAGVFNLDLQEPEAILDVEIYDPSGKLIWHSDQTSIKMTLDITGQPPGLYLLKITGNEGEIRQTKLVKE